MFCWCFCHAPDTRSTYICNWKQIYYAAFISKWFFDFSPTVVRWRRARWVTCAHTQTECRTGSSLISILTSVECGNSCVRLLLMHRIVRNLPSVCRTFACLPSIHLYCKQHFPFRCCWAFLLQRKKYVYHKCAPYVCLLDENERKKKRNTVNRSYPASESDHVRETRSKRIDRRSILWVIQLIPRLFTVIYVNSFNVIWSTNSRKALATFISRFTIDWKCTTVIKSTFNWRRRRQNINVTRKTLKICIIRKLKMW